MKKILLSFIFTLCFTTVFATYQHPDVLKYKGQEWYVEGNPLSYYFEQHPEKKPRAQSTGLWRGYRAVFGIKKNKLYLQDITDQDNFAPRIQWKSIKRKIFPNKEVKEIYWFTGILKAYGGKSRGLDFDFPYEKYLFMLLENGIVLKKKEFSYEEYKKLKEEQFQIYLQTNEEYKKMVAERDVKYANHIFFQKMDDDWIIKYLE